MIRCLFCFLNYFKCFWEYNCPTNIKMKVMFQIHSFIFVPLFISSFGAVHYCYVTMHHKNHQWWSIYHHQYFYSWCLGTFYLELTFLEAFVTEMACSTFPYWYCLDKHRWFWSCFSTNSYQLKHFPQGGSREMFSSAVLHALSQVQGLNSARQCLNNYLAPCELYFCSVSAQCGFIRQFRPDRETTQAEMLQR